MNIDIKRVKIYVTAPLENIEAIRKAVCKVGAGKIGNYDFCSFFVNGIGTVTPNDNAKPSIGTNGTMEIVKEAKIEFVCAI